jgi:hypothetical protein
MAKGILQADGTTCYTDNCRKHDRTEKVITAAVENKDFNSFVEAKEKTGPKNDVSYLADPSPTLQRKDSFTFRVAGKDQEVFVPQSLRKNVKSIVRTKEAGINYIITGIDGKSFPVKLLSGTGEGRYGFLSMEANSDFIKEFGALSDHWKPKGDNTVADRIHFALNEPYFYPVKTDK